MRGTTLPNGKPFEDDDQPILALYGERISPAVVSHATGAGGGGTGGAGSGDTVSGGAGGGLVINVTYDSSVANAPTGFVTAVSDVVQFFQTHFSDPVTINIAVGYGEVGGSRLPFGAIGASSTYLTSVSYASIVNALTADAKTAADASAAASLPAADPTGGHYWVSTAEGKALGLLGASNSIDGYVGFSSSAGIFDYNTADGVTAGSYDFHGVVAHEFSEVMGRILLTGGTVGGLSSSYVPLDLFHYSSPGVHDLVGSTPGYFSVDGGATSINTFNTTAGGDYGDWAGATVDAFNAFGSTGVVAPVSSGDITALDAIGWDAGAPPAAADLTVGNVSLTLTNQVTVNFTISNIGAVAAGASTAAVYLSTDTTIGAPDQRVGTVAIADLAAGASQSASLTLASGSVGTFYLGVVADSASAIAESNEANNSAAIKVILGNDSGNTLTGTTAADIIIGFGGNDTITGGTGADTLWGGGGADHFAYKAKTEGTDQILDFARGTDVIDFAASAFGKRLAVGNANTGTLDASHLVVNETGPSNSQQDFWFQPSTSTLYYDANGNGGGMPVAIAHLVGVTTLSNADIHLI
jgi:Ca2+-binding RTX toxin-like protein